MINVFQHEAFRDYFCQQQNESYTKNEMNVKILNQRKKMKNDSSSKQIAREYSLNRSCDNHYSD